MNRILLRKSLILFSWIESYQEKSQMVPIQSDFMQGNSIRFRFLIQIWFYLNWFYANLVASIRILDRVKTKGVWGSTTLPSPSHKIFFHFFFLFYSAYSTKVSFPVGKFFCISRQNCCLYLPPSKTKNIFFCLVSSLILD